MKKTLYLVRHGETLFNVQHKIQGWCDSPLTQKGIKQAIAVGEYFKKQGIQFDHAYCSTSERCVDTLELMVHMPYQRLKGLKEMNYGSLEGEDESKGSNDPLACITYYLSYGGESSDTTKQRMVDTLMRLMKQADHQQVLAVSHGGACFNFLRHWQDPTEILRKGIGNCCIFVYEYEHEQFTLQEVIPCSIDDIK